MSILRNRDILDKQSLLLIRIEASFAASKEEEAQLFTKTLLDFMPENFEYQKLFYKAHGVSDLFNPSNTGKSLELLRKLKQTLSSSYCSLLTVHELVLVEESEEFGLLFLDYFIKQTEKAVPSIFSQIKRVYDNPKKVEKIQKVLEESMKSLKESGKYSNGDEAGSSLSYLWSLYVFSQHLLEIGQYKKALDVINQAIDHTPTFIELYIVKARIYKRQGAFSEAAIHMKKARSLDYSDRYLSNKASRYLLRAGSTKEADAIIKSFIRDAGPESSIHDLQVMWFEQELAEAYIRKGHFGPGLRQTRFIYEHFEDMEEDQFDFHSYCMRKYTFQAYQDLVRSIGKFRNYRFFAQAGYLALHSIRLYQNYKEFVLKEEEEALKSMNKSERAKFRKQKQNKAKEDLITCGEAEKDYPAKVDLYGEELLKKIDESPAAEAFKFAHKLLEAEIADEQLNNWSMILAVDALREYPLLALKAFNKVRNPTKDQELLAKIRLRMSLQKDSSVPEISKITKEALGIVPELPLLLEQFKDKASSIVCKSIKYSRDHFLSESMQIRWPSSWSKEIESPFIKTW